MREKRDPTNPAMWTEVVRRPDLPEPCREWQGYCNGSGYGQTGEIDGRQFLSHRWVYEQAHGPLARGLKVCHHCDNPPCGQLSHLFEGTQAENLRDMRRKGRGTNPILPGESHGMHKLTDAIVRAIRASADSGPVLAKRYGVNVTNIGFVRRGVTWKHVV